MKKLMLHLGVLLAFAGAARADFNPLPINSSSYNFGVIVQSNGPTPVISGGATTASMDGGTGNNGDTWMEIGYFQESLGAGSSTYGLPAAGSTVPASYDANHTYTFASDYTVNNAIMLDAGFYTNADWKLNSPQAYKALSFLTSGGNGGAQFSYTVQYIDGTSETGITNSADWFFVNVNIAWIANGRCNAQSYTLDNANSNNPRLYSIDVLLSGHNSAVTNIHIVRTGGNASGHSCIMAISGTKLSDATGLFTPILGSGYTADIVVEAGAPRPWNPNYQVPGVIPNITATLDNGTNLNTEATPRLSGATWFEQGYYRLNPNFGLPHANTTFTAQSLADHHYKMPPSYSGNDAIMMDNSNTTATISLTTPTAASALSFLASSGGGNANVTADIVFSDASVETHYVTIGDWFGNSPVAVTANGRIDVGSGFFDTINGNNPRLLAVDISPLTETVKTIDHINLTWTNGGRPVIFAVSGAAGAVAPTVSVTPPSTIVSAGASVTLTANSTGTLPVGLQWQKGTNGVFVNLGGQTGATYNIASAGDADEADYRAIASNVAGSATSAVATVTILSGLPRITVPSDAIVAYQPLGGSSPAAESVVHAIDGAIQKYLNFGNGAAPIPPVGFDVTLSGGRSFLKVVRFYTANDSPDRDWANYVVFGSNDGTTWSMVASNLLSMPDGRNNAAGTTPIDPTTQFVTQVRLSNNNSYSHYRVYTTMTKNSGDNLMQIGEVEMLGTVDTSGFPVITVPPTNTYVYVGNSATFYVTATGTPAPTYQWQRNGVNLPGETQNTLFLSNVQFSDAVDFRVIVANTLQTLTSTVAHLTVYSLLNDVTQPGDATTEFGDASGTFYGTGRTPGNVFNNIFDFYLNGGHGFSAAAGFPPFLGPVGVTVTPAAGPSLLAGIRIYTASENPGNDPADVELYGSNDGNNWTPIFSTSLNLPTSRNDVANLVAPIDSSSGVPNSLQEFLFSNSGVYAQYKVQWTHNRDDTRNATLEVGEVELLGTVGVPLNFSFSGGQLTLTWSQGTLQEATSVNGPWTTSSATSPFIVNPTGPQHFYRLQVQ